MKGVLFVVAIAVLTLTCFSKAVYNKEVWLARDKGAEFDVMLRVVDDEGSPVANARCGGWMCMEHDSKHGRGYAIFTDTNGCARVTGRCSEWFSVVVRKDGYYKTSFDVKYPLENVDPPIADGKWQPYGETRTVVLKRIKQPHGMLGSDRLPQRKIKVYDKLRDFCFRIRTRRNDKGEIVEALYGKIYGDISFAPAFDLLENVASVCMLYYLNPTSLDRNLEWDMKNNLCPTADELGMCQP